jgi:hypothetical protein
VAPANEPSDEPGATLSLSVPRGPPEGDDRVTVRVPSPPSKLRALLKIAALLTVTLVKGVMVAPPATVIGPAVVSEMVGVSGSVV